MQFKAIFRLLSLIVMLVMSSTNVSAQDLLARQAPIDRKMKSVDTLALQGILNRENSLAPAVDLYDDFDTNNTHKYSEAPDTFRINLRGYCMPTPSRVVTSNFGPRWGRTHKGIDVKVYIGDTIRAAFAGKVRIVKYDANGYGYFIVIRHNNGLETIYGHLSKQLVKPNQTVRAGEVIGLGGNTGRSTGSHLHFETRLCGIAINPALLFDFRAQDVTCDSYLFVKKRFVNGRGNRTAPKQQVVSTPKEEILESTPAQTVQKLQPMAANSPEKKVHRVAAGETLYSIARQRGTTVDAIVKINHLSSATAIHEGQILRFE